MTLHEAGDYMMRLVSERAERFSGLGLSVKIERDLMDRLFSPTEKEKSARFITVSIVLGREDGVSKDEYALSLGAEVKRGEVHESELSRSLAELDAAITETVRRLSSAEDKGAELSALCRESDAEYDVFLNKMKKSSRISMIRSVAFSVIILLLMILLSFLTRQAAG